MTANEEASRIYLIITDEYLIILVSIVKKFYPGDLFLPFGWFLPAKIGTILPSRFSTSIRVNVNFFIVVKF